MSMPAQKPGRSKQDYGTPDDLKQAVNARWGEFTIDLAADDDGSNALASMWFCKSHDYLTADLVKIFGPDHSPLCWCNPPFANIRPWARKWRQDFEKGARIIALVPLSTCNWFADEVEGVANVVGLVDRVTFKGCSTPYPKDCMLLLYGIKEDREFQSWKWK